MGVTGVPYPWRSAPASTFRFYEWQLAHGQQPVIPASYPAGLRFRWLGGDIRRLGSLFNQRQGGWLSIAFKDRRILQFPQGFCRPVLSRDLVLDGSKAGVGRLARRPQERRSGRFVAGLIRNLKQTIAEYRYHGRPQFHGGFAFARSVCHRFEARLCSPATWPLSVPFCLCATATSFAAPWQKLCCANTFNVPWPTNDRRVFSGTDRPTTGAGGLPLAGHCRRIRSVARSSPAAAADIKN